MSWELMIVPLPKKEEALIKAAQQGDNEAFQTLVISYETTVLGFIYRLGVDADSTQDVAQNTFIKAWLALETYKHRQKFKSWLLKIAYHTTVDFWRRQRPGTNLETVTIQDTSIDVETQVSGNQQIEMVKEAIQRLPEQSRAALILREYHQYSYQEIAQTLDIPLGTVMSRLNYARSTLKKRLQPLLEKSDA